MKASEVHTDDLGFYKEVQDRVVGGAKLIDGSDIVLVPTPTNDPNGKT